MSEDAIKARIATLGYQKIRSFKSQTKFNAAHRSLLIVDLSRPAHKDCGGLRKEATLNSNRGGDHFGQGILGIRGTLLEKLCRNDRSYRYAPTPSRSASN